MIATIPYIQQQFDRFNAMCFEGKLPPVTIKLSRARSFLGRCEYRRVRKPFSRQVTYSNFVIKISTFRDLPQEELEDVILHEMIHYWIAYNGVKDSSAHGPVFREIMHQLNERFNRHMTVSHKSGRGEAAPVDNRIRVHCVCISDMGGGVHGITVCNPSMVETVNRSLPRRYRLQGRKWYISENPFFNRYPRSRKGVIYKITEEEMSAALQGARMID